MEKLKKSCKSEEEEHQNLLNQAEKSNLSMFRETPKPLKETEMFISVEPHFTKNDSNDKDFNFITESQQEVLVCSSTSSFRKKSNLLVNRTKSRLMEPSEQDQRSGVLLKDSEIEEDDLFSDEDLKVKFSLLTILQLVNAFRERRALALSLNDTKTAVNKLHQMLNVLVAIIILVIWLLILIVATMHFLVFLSSQILLVVFVFGNSAKTTYEAIIFLFVMHPFDVGDRVEVDGVQMVV
ncbi:mechanosensitive ion channel protein Msy2-like isoform X1 [Solanum pennellii]|uniref:Mechanosensitive ion channel protein Msy2-like isoform X1 n=1 Tax=Solanum pennellii TaxID=28526 RepID=A0ABM1V0C4_SOLPN|nr:mechanosensitive ion channel protein Msy2-like isoform X1 [Solanum pennellii]